MIIWRKYGNAMQHNANAFLNRSKNFGNLAKSLWIACGSIPSLLLIPLHLNHIHWAYADPSRIALQFYSTFGNIPPSWNLRKLQNTLNRSFQMRIPSRPLDQCAHGQPDIWFIGDLNVTSSLSVLQQSSHLLDQFAATQAHTQRTQIGFLRSLRGVWNWNGLQTSLIKSWRDGRSTTRASSLAVRPL